MENIIEVSNLRFSYGSKSVLKGINLQVIPGEIIGLIGENGAGKSTFLNILLGVLPDHGKVKVFSERPGSKVCKENIGSMLQGNMRINRINVFEMLEESAVHYSNSLPVDEVLKRIGLDSVKDQMITRLSGGQMRRLTFGMALIVNPKLLFLDEPTVGMDANARNDFWQQVRELKAQGITMIITSHYLEEIQQIADRLLILQDGVFSFQGTLAELQAQYHQTLIGFKTSIDPAMFSDLPGVEKMSRKDQHIYLTSDDGDLTLKALVPNFENMQEISVERQSLEDIFIKMTAREQN